MSAHRHSDACCTFYDEPKHRHTTECCVADQLERELGPQAKKDWLEGRLRVAGGEPDLNEEEAKP
jgi:hypothetical protein